MDVRMAVMTVAPSAEKMAAEKDGLWVEHWADEWATQRAGR